MIREGTISKFPQIPRFFSAPIVRKVLMITGKFFLWSTLLFVVGINAGLVRPQGKFMFLNSVKLDRLISTVTSKSQDILGVQHQTSPTPQVPDGLESQYQYWLTIVSDHPDYRDGFVRLATLAYQRGDRDKSREFIERIRALDPNFEDLRELEALLQTQ